MILAIVAALLVAEADASRTCILNGTDQPVSIFGNHEAADGKSARIVVELVSPGAEVCFPAPSDSPKPIRLQVVNANDNSPQAAAFAQWCPNIAPNSGARLV